MMTLIHHARVDAMTPDQAKRPSVLDGIPDEDPGDGRDQAPVDAVAGERKRRRRAIALVAIMLLGIIAIIFTLL
jgi:hypothetical protein